MFPDMPATKGTPSLPAISMVRAKRALTAARSAASGATWFSLLINEDTYKPARPTLSLTLAIRSSGASAGNPGPTESCKAVKPSLRANSTLASE